MRLLKQALAALGALVVLALVLAFVAPKRTQGLVAALVQIVPGTTTHIGQNESRMVSLTCATESSFCNSVDPSGNVASAAYQVPAGFTLIITDYEYKVVLASTAGQFLCDTFFNISTGMEFLNVPSCALADSTGQVYGKEHFTTGVRVGSGVTVADFAAANREGFANLQGYLVPNN